MFCKFKLALFFNKLIVLTRLLRSLTFPAMTVKKFLASECGYHKDRTAIFTNFAQEKMMKIWQKTFRREPDFFNITMKFEYTYV